MAGIEACAKAAVWHGGSWISLAFRGFNKGLKGAELFCAAETCCVLASGSLLAAGGESGGVGSCLLTSLPGKDSCCRMNAALQSPLVCHPASLRGLDGGANCQSVPLEKHVLAEWGEMPKDVTAAATRDAPSAGQAPGV